MHDPADILDVADGFSFALEMVSWLWDGRSVLLMIAVVSGGRKARPYICWFPEIK
jgi:hypothetical protein